MRLNRGRSTFIICVSDGAETFLSCSIPDLQFDVFAITVDCLESKVDSDSGHVVLVELVVGKTKQEATLAH